MSDAEFVSEPQYPPYFNPDEFTTPEIFLLTLMEPGVISIGEDISDDRQSGEQKAQEQAERFDWGVGYLFMMRQDGRKAVFPVYRVSSESEVTGSDGTVYGFRSPYPNMVTEDHVRAAEGFVQTMEGFEQMPQDQRRRLVARHALVLASGGKAFRVSADGVEPLLNPDSEAEEHEEDA